MAKRICETCGLGFESRKVKAYCSERCDPRRRKTCGKCGALFFDQTRTNIRSYCGDDCNPATRKSRAKTCGYCASEFEDTSQQNSMRFCSIRCRQKAKGVRRSETAGEGAPLFLDEQRRDCEACGQEFVPTAANQKYCSRICRQFAFAEERYADVPPNFPRTIECAVCGKNWYGSIPHGGRSGHHPLQAHGLDTNGYRRRYPEASFYSPAALYMMRTADRTFPDDFSKVMSEAQRRRYETEPVWNKGLTADDHPGIAQIARKAAKRLEKPKDNPFFGRSHSEETRQALSRIMLDKFTNDEEFRINVFAGQRRFFKTGHYISEPHQRVWDGLEAHGLAALGSFENEVFVTLPGGRRHPIDIGSRRLGIAIEVDGCFWHGCPEHGKYEALSNHWKQTIDRQRARDRAVDEGLARLGYAVLRLWQHQINRDIGTCIERIQALMNARDGSRS